MYSGVVTKRKRLVSLSVLKDFLHFLCCKQPEGHYLYNGSLLLKTFFLKSIEEQLLLKIYDFDLKLVDC